MSNWINVLDVFLERNLQGLNETPFPDTVDLPLEQALRTAISKINPNCNDDYLAGVRDVACCYIEARLAESDYACEWVDGSDHTGHFVLRIRGDLVRNDSLSANE